MSLGTLTKMEGLAGFPAAGLMFTDHLDKKQFRRLSVGPLNVGAT